MSIHNHNNRNFIDVWHAARAQLCVCASNTIRTRRGGFDLVRPWAPWASTVTAASCQPTAVARAGTYFVLLLKGFNFNYDRETILIFYAFIYIKATACIECVFNWLVDNGGLL